MTEAATVARPRLRAVGLPLPRCAFLHYDAGEMWSRIPAGAVAEAEQYAETLGQYRFDRGQVGVSLPELSAFLRAPDTLELVRSWAGGLALQPLHVPRRTPFAQLTVDRPGAADWPRPRWPQPDPERPVVLHLFLSTHENGEGGALELRVASANANSLVVRPYRGHAVLFSGSMPHRVHPVATGLDGKPRPRLCLEAAFAPVEG